jgi:hypothetical protein
MYRELTYLISSDNRNSNGNRKGNSNGNGDGRGKESSPRWARRPLNKPSTTHQRYIQPKLRRILRNSCRLNEYRLPPMDQRRIDHLSPEAQGTRDRLPPTDRGRIDQELSLPPIQTPHRAIITGTPPQAHRPGGGASG